MTQETVRIPIVDPQEANNVVSVVESIDEPGKFGVVLLQPNGDNI